MSLAASAIHGHAADACKTSVVRCGPPVCAAESTGGDLTYTHSITRLRVTTVEPMNPSEKPVRHFRQILLWPLQLIPIRGGAQIQKHWELLQQDGADNPWHEVVDEFTGEHSLFKERHYGEFVTFLPYVQRLLYGEGRAQRTGASSRLASPMRVFRRDDVSGSGSPRRRAMNHARSTSRTSISTSSMTSTSCC